MNPSLPTFEEFPHTGGRPGACEKPEGPYTASDEYDIRCPRCRLALASLAKQEPMTVIDDYLIGDRVTVARASDRYGPVSWVAE